MNINALPSLAIKDSLAWFPQVHDRDWRTIEGRKIDVGALVHFALGLAGEAGEVANKIKKLNLYQEKNTVTLEEIRMELADVLIYLMDLFYTIGAVPDETFLDKREILVERWGNPDD